MAKHSGFKWTASEPHNVGYLFPKLLDILDSKQKIILDVGCGNGAIACRLLDLGYNVYGIDASENGITVANEHKPGRFFIQDISSDSLPEELQGIHFDVIISTEVIEHLYSPGSYIKFMKSILEKEGELIISTPYHGYLKNLILAISGKMDFHFTALWEGGHIKFWSRKTLTELCRLEGFKVTKFYGCGRYPYLWKSMLLHTKLVK